MKWLPFYRPTSSNLEGNSPKIAQLELLNQVHPKNLKGEKIKFKISGLQIHDWARNRVWGLNVVLERQACEAQGWRVLPIEGHTTMTLHIKSMNWQERCINAEKQVDELKKERQNLRNRNTRLEKRMAEAKQKMAKLKKGKGDGGATAKRKREGAVVIDSDDEPILKKPKQILRMRGWRTGVALTWTRFTARTGDGNASSINVGLMDFFGSCQILLNTVFPKSKERLR
jgi:hypothetical protein